MLNTHIFTSLFDFFSSGGGLGGGGGGAISREDLAVVSFGRSSFGGAFSLAASKFS